MPRSQAPSVEVENEVTIIQLGPEYENLDESQLERLSPAIMEAVDSAQPPKVVLDLSHTRFFGSAFIEVIFRAWKSLRSRSGAFVISGLTPYCAEVVSVTHLDRLWTVVGDREEAVRTLSAASAPGASSDAEDRGS